MSKNFLTREGYDKLIAELQELKQDKLPAVLERLAEAKAMGDLSENFEYKSAMEDKDFINSRIAEITNLIADVEIVEKDKDVSKVGKVVDFWSKVTELEKSELKMVWKFPLNLLLDRQLEEERQDRL